MRVLCLHGYFIFEPSRVSDISKLNSIYRAGLVKRQGRGFTFARLSGIEDYSLEGKTYIDTVADFTFEGKPWEVMRKNGIVFDFTEDASFPVEMIDDTLNPRLGRFTYSANGLIVPGTLSESGRILSYSGVMKEDSRFYYDWIESDG